jgi:hypothetical protein
MKRILYFVAFVLVAMSALNSKGGPVADYGDAPDGVLGRSYPSNFNSPNAAPGQDAPFHFDVTREWLGVNGPPTTTTVEANSIQVNGDFDDSGSSVFMLNAAGIGQRGYLYTTASYDPNLSTASQTRYLNAAVDLNDNGVWGDVSPSQREWVVRNVPFNFSGLPAGVTNMNIFVGFHLDPALVGATNRWTRVTLSTQPVVPGPNGEWNGSGPAVGFARGETEDFLNQTVLTSTLDANGVGGGNAGGPNGGPGNGGGGFGPKNLTPLAVSVTPDISPDGFHALTPAGPGPLVHVADVKLNVPQAAVNPANAFGGEALLNWTRTCDIGGGDCNHLPFQGPNPVAAILGGKGGGLALAGAGFTVGLVAGANTIPVLARFPNPNVNGDTHSIFNAWVDPASTFYLNLQNDDTDLYSGANMYPTDVSKPDFLYPAGTVPEPAAVMLAFSALFCILPSRLRTTRAT